MGFNNDGLDLATVSLSLTHIVHVGFLIARAPVSVITMNYS